MSDGVYVFIVEWFPPPHFKLWLYLQTSSIISSKFSASTAADDLALIDELK